MIKKLSGVLLLSLIGACIDDSNNAPGATSSSGGTPDSSVPPEDGAASSSSSSGSSGQDGSANDGGPRCNPASPFGAPTLLAGISTSIAENSVWVSPDELTAYTTRPDNTSTNRIWVSRRPNIGVDFSAPALESNLAPINAPPGYVALGSLSPDQLIIYVYKQPVGGNAQVLVASRGTKDSAFSIPQSGTFENKPAEGYISPRLAPDGALILTHLSTLRLFRAPSVTSPLAFSAPKRIDALAGPVDAGAFECSPGPFLATGQMIFSCASALNPGQELFLSDSTLSNPQPLTNLNSPKNEWAGSISGDGCAFYFTSDRSGAGDVFVSLRGK